MSHLLQVRHCFQKKVVFGAFTQTWTKESFKNVKNVIENTSYLYTEGGTAWIFLGYSVNSPLDVVNCCVCVCVCMCHQVQALQLEAINCSPLATVHVVSESQDDLEPRQKQMKICDGAVATSQTPPTWWKMLHQCWIMFFKKVNFCFRVKTDDDDRSAFNQFCAKSVPLPRKSKHT